MLTYIAKNNSNESIHTVSDEDKRKECDFYNTLRQFIGVGRQVLKRCVRGQQNNKTQTSSLGTKVNVSKWNYLVQWASWIHGRWQRDCKAESDNQFRHVCRSAGSHVTSTAHIFA